MTDSDDAALGFRVAQLERRVNGIPERIAVLEVRMVEIGTSLGHLERGQEKTRDAIEADIQTVKTALRLETREVKEALERREDEKAKERSADRRWLVGTGLTTAGLVIGALALLAPSF